MKHKDFIIISGILALIFSTATACSKPGPAITLKVKPAHVKAIEASYLVRANEARDDWKEAEKERILETKMAQMRKLDMAQANAWLEGAQIQLERAKFIKGHKDITPDVDQPKSLDAVTKELKLAKLYKEYRALQYEHHDLLIRLFTWKVYTFQAQYWEELVTALHKIKAPAAAAYSKIKFMDQSYKVKRQFLILEEEYKKVEERMEKLKKEIDALWDPSYRKNEALPRSKPCRACAPCPSTPGAQPAKPVPAADATLTEPQPETTTTEPAKGTEEADPKEPKKDSAGTPDPPATKSPPSTEPKKTP